ncbi:MAG: glycosyltransferase family 2 protein [Hyphomonas sp.]
MAVPKFSVLIVNYNGGDFVQKALDSLAQQTRRDFEVILVDNASSDGSIDHLDASGLPSFTLLAEPENHGYAGGSNLCARSASGKWLVCLNPDAIAEPDFLAQIDAGISRYPSVRMFACAQLSLEDNNLLDGAGDAYLVFGIPWRGGFGRRSHELPPEGECFSPCGASAVFERETFLSHGGFDEDFFCFCEDVDLGFRLRLEGEVCIFLPQAVIHHFGGGLSGRESDFSTYHGCRNRVWTYARNMPSMLFWPTLPGHLVLSAYILIRNLATNRFLPTWKGMRDGLAGAVRFRRKGRETRRRCPSQWKLARSMAWNPFRMSQRRVHVRPALPPRAVSASSLSPATHPAVGSEEPVR